MTKELDDQTERVVRADARAQIVNLEIEVHRHLRMSFRGRPDGARVVTLPLKGQVVARVLRWRDRSTWCVRVGK